jgi:organic radical activating enzyme
MEQNKYPTFCILPFTHISSTNDGNYRVCCCSEEGKIPKSNGSGYNTHTDNVTEVWNSPLYKQLRLDLINGVKNKACDYCWNYEASGAYSKRQKNNDEKRDTYVDYQHYIDDALSNDGALTELPTDLDLRVGTLCNLKCITCYPGASSLHAEESEQMVKLGHELPGLHKMFKTVFLTPLNKETYQYNPVNIDVSDEVSNLEPVLKIAKHMSLVGGEPLVNKTTTRILEQCVDKGYAKTMKLQIITNLSVINNKTINLLEQFEHSMLCVSWDHIDPAKFNYIRYPLDYNIFTKNFETVWEHSKIQKKLSTTWSIFNIMDFEDIFDEWERISQRNTNIPFVINHGLVYYPNYFSIRYLEPEQKLDITERTHNYLSKNKDFLMFKNNPEFVEALISLKDYMGETYNDHENVCKERTRVLKLYDTMRNTQYKQLFPFIKDYE